MITVIDNKEYKVIVNKKRIKNTYLRVKEDLSIHISTNHFVSKRDIENFIESNKDSIRLMINKQIKKNNKKDDFYYLGKAYEVTNKEELENVDKWYKKQASKIFSERYDYLFSKFESKVLKPTLKIRKMKSRWGVCNRRRHTITLNLELIKKDIIIIDYVIIHELCHLVHFNHSKNFWNLVGYYIPNYKQLRKLLKE
jgi:hypothetical protein